MSQKRHLSTIVSFAALLAIGASAIQFRQGVPLEDFPLVEKVLGGDAEALQLDFVAEPLQGPADQGTNLMLQMTAFMFRLNGSASLHGPLLRFRAGQQIHVNVTNQLVGQMQNSTGQDMRKTMNAKCTNLHMHGVHLRPRPLQMSVQAVHEDTNLELVTDMEGDNPFFVIPPRPSASDPAYQINYHLRVPTEHMPGFFWYHPHVHGFSAVQTMSANGAIIVEDDPRWLPDPQGCDHIRALLMGPQRVVDRVLMLSLWSFPEKGLDLGHDTDGDEQKVVLNPVGPADIGPSEAFFYYAYDGAANAADDSYAYISEGGGAETKNPYCCNESRTGYPFKSNGEEFVLVNGILEPIISMQADTWQRWRIVCTFIYKFIDLTIKTATGEPAPCEMALFAKDGIYLMEIPRRIDHIFLGSGMRVELLVRCSLPPGSTNATYVLTSMNSTVKPSPGCLTNHCIDVLLDVAHLHVTRGVGPPGTGPSARLPDRGCVPLRPSYAPDLRDQVLDAHLVPRDVLRQSTISLRNEQDGSCTINGARFDWPVQHPMYLEMGTLVQWSIPTVHVHPYHLHSSPYQIIYMPGWSNDTSQHNYTTFWEPGDWHDTLLLPPYNPLATEERPQIRFQPGPEPGYSVLHCHILQHADEGCMVAVQIRCPGFPKSQPEQCPGFAYPIAGTWPEIGTEESY